MNVMILTRDGFLYKRFCDDLVPDLDRVLVNDLELRCFSVLSNGDPPEFKFLMDSSIEFRSTIPIHGQSTGGGDTDLIQDLQDQTSIPKDGLEINLVDTKGCPQFHIFDGLT